jgi:putative sigma-54 modulation protein
MQIVLQGAYLQIFPDLRQYVERRLSYAIGRCRVPVRQATVSLRNLRAKQRGADWFCEIRLRLEGRRPVSADARCPMPSEAIKLASLRLGKRTARLARGRKRAFPQEDAPSSPAQPQWGGRTMEHVPRAIRIRR